MGQLNITIFLSLTLYQTQTEMPLLFPLLIQLEHHRACNENHSSLIALDLQA